MKYSLKSYALLVIALNVLFYLLLSGIAAHADTLTFTWDYPAETEIDGFKLYSGHMGQNEDESWSPQYGALPLVDAIPADARRVTAVEVGWPDQSKKFCFTLRAYRGGNESPDSNFVCATIDNTPLAAPQISAAEYDPAAGAVRLSWTADEDPRLKYFQIFYRVGDDATFVHVGTVEKPETMPVLLETAIDAVGPGESKTLHFAVVGYKSDSVFSPNSSEFSLLVDRSDQQEIPAPVDFQFEATIPVQ